MAVEEKKKTRMCVWKIFQYSFRGIDLRNTKEMGVRAIQEVGVVDTRSSLLLLMGFVTIVCIPWLKDEGCVPTVAIFLSYFIHSYVCVVCVCVCVL